MSKGGSTTSKTEIPEWLENAAIENINKGRDVSQIGYTPYYGPDVAAFSPMQTQSMQSTGNAASAFGLAPQGFDAMAGMPQAQTFAGGVQGYSSAPLYEESLATFKEKRPAQYNAIMGMFIDPITGQLTQRDYSATDEQKDQMIDRTPTVAPDYSININNQATGGSGTGGAGGTGTGGAGGTAAGGAGGSNWADIDTDTTGWVGDATGGAGGAGGVGGVGGATYDSIYNQAEYGDLTGGETFTGDDGEYYTVGGGEGQVDAGLANAVVDGQAAVTTPYNMGSVTEVDVFTGDDGGLYEIGGGVGQVDAGLAGAVGTGALPDNLQYGDWEPEDYSLEGGLPAADAPINLGGDYGTDYSDPTQPPVDSSGVVDPLMTSGEALGNIATTVSPTLGLLDTILGDDTLPPVTELDNSDAIGGLLDPRITANPDAARDLMLRMIVGLADMDMAYDMNRDGTIDISDISALNQNQIANNPSSVPQTQITQNQPIVDPVMGTQVSMGNGGVLTTSDGSPVYTAPPVESQSQKNTRVASELAAAQAYQDLINNPPVYTNTGRTGYNFGL
jgi:hypothetical protein